MKHNCLLDIMLGDDHKASICFRVIFSIFFATNRRHAKWSPVFRSHFAAFFVDRDMFALFQSLGSFLEVPCCLED